MSVMKSALVLLLVSLAVADELNSDSKSTEKFTPNNGIALCEEVKVDDYCGPSAECRDFDNHNDHDDEDNIDCLCKDGFAGKPPSCDGCIKDIACGPTEYCKAESNKCSKGCRTDNCPPGHYCHLPSRQCRSGCESDKHCPVEYYCDKTKGECQRGCRTYGCDRGEFCSTKTRECLDGCEESTNCRNNNEYCHPEDHYCENICGTYKCIGDNTICRALDHEKYCGCQDGYKPVAGKGCVKTEEHAEREDFDKDKCASYCAPGAKCMKDNQIIFCKCPGHPKDNPFVECTSRDEKR